MFESSVHEIIAIKQCSDFFLCYSSTEAVICTSKDSNLCAERRFFKVANIKTVLNNLTIQKIIIHTSTDLKLTIIVLLNDKSLYIYEDISLNDPMWINLIKMTKHIHPVERRDFFCSNLDDGKSQPMSDFNNSKLQFVY